MPEDDAIGGGVNGRRPRPCGAPACFTFVGFLPADGTGLADDGLFFPWRGLYETRPETLPKMSKPLIYAAIGLAVAMPFAVQAKTKPSSSTSAPASSAPADSSSSSSSSDSAPPASSSSMGSSGSATSPSASTGASADTTATAPAFAVGTPVKDNTGTVIGSITEVKPGATGAQTATIKMGSDQFAVATSGLAMQDGAAVINMSQAELQAKLHPAGAK